MRSVRFLLFVVAGAAALAACSIHPVPFDVPGYRTIDIVKRIRCEAKQALDKFAQEDAFKRRIYDNMTIGYKFTFTITENNNLGAKANLFMPISNGTFTLGINGGSERERVGIRDFTFVDNFREARDEQVCNLGANGNKDRNRENFAYPITGRIGLEEVIRTYLELQTIGLGKLPPVVFKLPPRDPELRKLAKKQDRKAPATATAEFVETFEFATTISAGASPKVELKPIGSGLSLTQASGDLSGSRTDRHAVIVTLAPNYTDALVTLNSQDISTRLRRIENLTRNVPIQ